MNEGAIAGLFAVDLDDAERRRRAETLATGFAGQRVRVAGQVRVRVHQ